MQCGLKVITWRRVAKLYPTGGVAVHLKTQKPVVVKAPNNALKALTPFAGTAFRGPLA